VYNKAMIIHTGTAYLT